MANGQAEGSQNLVPETLMKNLQDLVVWNHEVYSNKT